MDPRRVTVVTVATMDEIQTDDPTIAIVERFIRSMKHECTRRLVVPPRRERTRREIAFYVECYNAYHPHSALGVRTPDEVYNGLPAAGEKS